ncbi:MAG TPA: hypothetical protein VI011_07255 [Asanoa sp.]
MESLGVDVGGVLIVPDDEVEDTSFFGANYLRTPAMPDAFAGLAALVRDRFGERVHLVSTCSESTERRTREWLAHHDFYARTGVAPRHVHFVRTREAKAPVAASLGLTHFVDDKLEVLSYLVTVAHRFLFHPRTQEIAAHRARLAGVRRVETWPELVSALLPGAGEQVAGLEEQLG